VKHEPSVADPTAVARAAREAGLTYAAVREILANYQREDEDGTSFGRMVEALRELAVATALRLHEQSDSRNIDG